MLAETATESREAIIYGRRWGEGGKIPCRVQVAGDITFFRFSSPAQPSPVVMPPCRLRPEPHRHGYVHHTITYRSVPTFDFCFPRFHDSQSW